MRWILFTTSAAVHFGTEVEFSAVLAQRFPQGGLGVVCGVGEAELANAVLGYWPGSVLYLVDAYIQVYPPPQDKSKGYKSDKHYQLQFERIHKSFEAMNIPGRYSFVRDFGASFASGWREKGMAPDPVVVFVDAGADGDSNDRDVKAAELWWPLLQPGGVLAVCGLPSPVPDADTWTYNGQACWAVVK